VVVFEDAPHGLLLGRDWLRAVDGVVGYRQGVWGVFLGEEFVPSGCQLLAEVASEADFEEEDPPLLIDDSWLEEIDSETEEESLGLPARSVVDGAREARAPVRRVDGRIEGDMCERRTFH